MDPSAFAIQSSFLFDQGAHFRSALARGLRKRAMPNPMGMLEPLEQLTRLARSRAKYRTSLQALRRAKALSAEVVTKSGVMLGLGEKETELFQTMDDLREAGCEVLTMGQYLRPTPKHLPVVEYITPEQFNYYGDIARRKGFLHVASGPLVRSSYHAADFHPVIPR